MKLRPVVFIVCLVTMLSYFVISANPSAGVVVPVSDKDSEAKYHIIASPTNTIATLSNGTGDGSVQITVDGYGSFGSSTPGGNAVYDPIGSWGPAGTVYESAIYFSPLGNFLTTDSFGAQLPFIEFTYTTSTIAKSQFDIEGFHFVLTQRLTPIGQAGSTLIQQYSITNNTGVEQTFKIIRHVDGDLYYEGNYSNDFGGVSADGKTLYEFDTGDDPAHPTTFVGIQSASGNPSDFTIQPFRFTDNIVYSEGIPFAVKGKIYADDNANGITDYGYDVTLSQEYIYIASPGATVIFVTKTIFGEGSVDQLLGIKDKVICGYQGWFNCEGDNSPIDKYAPDTGWRHWSHGDAPFKRHQHFELYPDISNYSFLSLFQTGYSDFGNGQPAKLFSSYSNNVISRQFSWMKTYGIDGIALQRFGTEVRDPRIPAHFYADNRNSITRKVMSAAETYGRLFYIMYDISGMSETTNQNVTEFTKVIKDDWTRWLTNPSQLDVTSSVQYAKQDGKPVVCIWGIGFKDRPGTVAQFLDLINWFKAQGCYVVGGVPCDWRTGIRGESKTGFLDVYKTLDMISPWAVGRYSTDDEVESWYSQFLTPDRDFCKQYNIAYQPVIFPGFAWSNWNGGSPNQIPRRGGKLFWRQAYNVRKVGIPAAYIAMFDEYDEGTAIAKAAEDSSMIPTDQYFLTLSADGIYVSSDFYLRLADKATRMIKGLDPLVRNIPIPYSKGPVMFRTSLEKSYDAWPTWTDTVDPTGGSANISGYAGSGSAECGSVGGEQSHVGEYAIRYSGRDLSESSSYCYFKIFNVNINVTDSTKLSFWIYPQQELGRYVAVDFIMTDGSTLRDSGAVDHDGVSMHPGFGRGSINTWTQIKCDVGKWLNNKSIDRIVIGYDHAAETGDFRGYIDDILITNTVIP